MVARPGRLQSAFTAGELDPLLHERSQLKYFSTGADHMENVVSIPQGGFGLRGGLLDIGAVDPAASRLFDFKASDGSAYDLVFAPGKMEAWGNSGKLQDLAIPALSETMLPGLNDAQQRDTMILLHADLQPQRIKHAGPQAWSADAVPLTGLPSYDYGATYSNGVAAVWRLEFVGLDANSIFTLTISQEETVSIGYTTAMGTLASRVRTAVQDLPNVAPGISVASAGGSKIAVTFSGENNAGDGWAVSGNVINKADAAILAAKTTVGVAPGEPVISSVRGWPRCGAFYNQRLLLGGFKGLPNAWMFSLQGDYFNFDERFSAANGPALIPMDVDGGEVVEQIVPSRNLAIFTNGAEYWIAERGLSRTEPPNHVQAGERGVKNGVPIVANEGALNFVSSTGSVIGEFRYTDVEGNFVSRDISLLGSHLIIDVKDQAMRRAEKSTSGNLNGIVLEDGQARLATLLREQDVTAFSRMTSDSGHFKAVSVNGRNEMSWIVDRPAGRRLERLVTGYLLDEAQEFTFSAPQSQIFGLARFENREIWVVGDSNVMGPYLVQSGVVTLDFPVVAGYLGTWAPPKVTMLPPPRDIGPAGANVVLKRRLRIHSAKISVLDTTSLAIGINDGPLKDVGLQRYGLQADTAELRQGVTETITVRGLTGFHDEPKLTLSQLRPGKLTVRSVTIEAAL
ncbi:hypothetical protein TRICHSKD4_4953 [Roseibium sp. TrichSKD4]|uniref:hypothetical protein n=1 Tax=Roseibium sp. TrichSKD4 TaxID=744980 RepID=UPI0001E57332|nr:hypothetical protein [Roseibium sp. TrichSKD4]EFO29138.1 hypothetical protein TRICHSKD4_4953 [Roseibium sp. TrichSKD4]